MLQSIEHQAGLPIALDPAAGIIHWPDSISVVSTSMRTYAEMREYIAEPDARPTRDIIYYVYRKVARREDAERIDNAKLRYDITVIPPGCFSGQSKEFFRTAGHYHPLVPNTDIAYPEIYEVISGRAYWLLQLPEAGNPDVLSLVYLVEAGPGEKAVMLPGFGHISINAGPEPLVMANWIADTFTYDYGPYKRFRGGGYRIVEGAMPDTVELEPNRNYKTIPEFEKLRPCEIPALGLSRSQPLYSLSASLDALSFLHDPRPLASDLTVDKCYRRAL